MRQTFKFGRGYFLIVDNFELFDPRFFDIVNIPHRSAYYSTQGENGTSGSSGGQGANNPQLAMTGIKKYYQKGKYPKPRNT